MQTAPPSRSHRIRTAAKLAGAALGLGVLIWAMRLGKTGELLKESLDWIAKQGAAGVVAFIAVYVLTTVLFIPGSVLTLGAGAVFGVARGSLYVSIASTLGATAAFLIARFGARHRVLHLLDRHPNFRNIDQAVARDGWKIVLLTRLSPVFPFNVLNYAYGLTPIPLVHYILASWLGMLPGTVLYVYLGSLATTAAAQPRSRTAGEWLVLGGGLLATLLVTLLISRIARQALSHRLAQNPASPSPHPTPAPNGATEERT